MTKCAICDHETAAGVVVHRGCLTAQQDQMTQVKQENAILRVLGIMLAFTALSLAALMIV